MVGDPGREHDQDLSEEGLGAALVGLQVAGPLGLGLGQGTNFDTPVPQLADGPDGVRPAAADAVDGTTTTRVSPPARRPLSRCQPRHSRVPVEPETPTSRKMFSRGTPARRSCSSGDVGSMPVDPSWSCRLVRM